MVRYMEETPRNMSQTTFKHKNMNSTYCKNEKYQCVCHPVCFIKYWFQSLFRAAKTLKWIKKAWLIEKCYTLHHSCFTPEKRSPDTHWIRVWVGPETNCGCSAEEKIPSPCRESNPVVQPVAWLSYSCVPPFLKYLCLLSYIHELRIFIEHESISFQSRSNSSFTKERKKHHLYER
jgi:hypothetical protein